MTFDSTGKTMTPSDKGQAQSPDSAAVYDFINHTRVGDGLSKNELDEIITDPSKAADATVASFLKENFDDMRRLSSKGTNEVVSEDLNVYAELLRQAESNVGQGMPVDSGLYSMHSKLENRAGFLLPAIGGIFGFSGGASASPIFAALGGAVTHRFGRPAQMIGWVGGGVASVLTGTYIGASVGGIIDRGLKGDSHQQYFIDEAAPAMKRLLQKQYPSDQV